MHGTCWGRGPRACWLDGNNLIQRQEMDIWRRKERFAAIIPQVSETYSPVPSLDCGSRALRGSGWEGAEHVAGTGVGRNQV